MYTSFKGKSDNKKYFFLIEPLVCMIQGGAMVASQETAAQVLLDLVRVAKEMDNAKLIELAADDCFEVFLVRNEPKKSAKISKKSKNSKFQKFVNDENSPQSPIPIQSERL